MCFYNFISDARSTLISKKQKHHKSMNFLVGFGNEPRSWTEESILAHDTPSRSAPSIWTRTRGPLGLDSTSKTSKKRNIPRKTSIGKDNGVIMCRYVKKAREGEKKRIFTSSEKEDTWLTRVCEEVVEEQLGKMRRKEPERFETVLENTVRILEVKFRHVEQGEDAVKEARVVAKKVCSANAALLFSMLQRFDDEESVDSSSAVKRPVVTMLKRPRRLAETPMSAVSEVEQGTPMCTASAGSGANLAKGTPIMLPALMLEDASTKGDNVVFATPTVLKKEKLAEAVAACVLDNDDWGHHF